VEARGARWERRASSSRRLAADCAGLDLRITTAVQRATAGLGWISRGARNQPEPEMVQRHPDAITAGTIQTFEAAESVVPGVLSPSV
jgi:hypothetical protein